MSKAANAVAQKVVNADFGGQARVGVASTRQAGKKQVAAVKVGAKPATNDAQGSAPKPTGAERLLATYSQVLSLPSLRTLRFHLVNELRPYLGYRQAFLIEDPAGQARVKAISSLAQVDRNVPLTRWMESIVKAMRKEQPLDKAIDFELPAFAQADKRFARQYPFGQFMWLPLVAPNGHVFAGLLLTASRPWSKGQRDLANRLAKLYAHAWCALKPPGKRTIHRTARRVWPWALALVALAMFIPVPMSTLAPAQIVARDPVLVTAPIRGVVDQVLVSANTPVQKGEPLVQLVDTELRSQLEVANRSVQVAQATLRKTTGGVFNDPSKKRDLAIAKAELNVKRAERDYTARLLAQTQILAPTDGLAVFENSQEWRGRPVATGEKIMAIANTDKVEVIANLPVGDAITLKESASVKLFLHADPLNPIQAEFTRASYEARPTDEGTLAYRVRAKISSDAVTPRIGLRGTAKLSGESAPLGFYLFRRPLSAFRQRVGW